MSLKSSLFGRSPSPSALTRREFLGAASAFAAGASRVAGLAAPLASLSEHQQFGIGYQIFGWGRYFPPAWWTGARAVSELGYRGIEGEYTIAELYEGRENEFEEKMERLQIRLAALYSTTDLERAHEHHVNIDKNLKAAAFCRRMGGRVMVLGGTHAQDRSPQAFRTFARAADELGKMMLEEHGVKCSYHPHLGSLVENREQIDRIMESTDPRYFFLAPDTAHLMAGGSDPVEIFRIYRTRIAHTHLKDYAPPQGPSQRGMFLPLGRGQVDFRGLMSLLLEEGFRGWATVELDATVGMTQSDVAKLARDYLVQDLGLSLDLP